MTVRVALLRGINLGPHKKVAMADLRQIASDLGLAEPETYVRSGNLVFSSDLAEIGVVALLEKGLVDGFGFAIPVICRSAQELAEVSRSHPFSDLGIDDRLLQVAFLDREPEAAIHDVIDADTYSPDQFRARGREIYLAYPGGSGRSKLNHTLLEQRLGVSATMRNWRTVQTLAGMASGRQSR